MKKRHTHLSAPTARSLFVYTILTICLSVGIILPVSAQKLIWQAEFDEDGPVDRSQWNFEQGFVRNHEYQWYQESNAYVKDGLLVIEGRLDSIPNPQYRPADNQSASGQNGQTVQRRRGGNDWRAQRPFARYSSASINTRGHFEFLYGRMEVRARIPAVMGSWPAIWLLGSKYGWPSSGEIDVMEYYHVGGVPHILANAA